MALKTTFTTTWSAKNGETLRIPIGPGRFISKSVIGIEINWGDSNTTTIAPTRSYSNTSQHLFEHTYTSDGGGSNLDERTVTIKGGWLNGVNDTQGKWLFPRMTETNPDRDDAATMDKLVTLTYTGGNSGGKWFLHGQGEFNGCSKLTTVSCAKKPELLYRNTSGLDDAESTFQRTQNTSSGYKLESTFEGCTRLDLQSSTILDSGVTFLNSRCISTKNLFKGVKTTHWPDIPNGVGSLVDCVDFSGMFEDSNLNPNIGQYATATATNGFRKTNASFNGGAYELNLSNMYKNCKFNNNTFNDRAFSTTHATNMSGMFDGCSNLVQNTCKLDKMDVSSATNMSRMLAGTKNINITGTALNAWDVSEVTDFTSMFEGSNFNGTISGWDIGSNTGSTPNIIFKDMFKDSGFGNNSVNSWTTTKVIDMSGMFDGSKITVMLRNTDTSNVTTMARMYKGTAVEKPYNNNWNKFDIGKVTNFESMFESSKFNGPFQALNLGEHITEPSISMSRMFADSAFNQPLKQINTVNVTNMSGMLQDCAAFDKNLDAIKWLNTSNVTDMSLMFAGCTKWAPTGDLRQISVTTGTSGRPSWVTGAYTAWDVSNVTNFAGMFSNGKANPQMNNWTLSSTKEIVMSEMFQNNTAFNRGSIGNWDISMVVDMSGMFDGATALPGGIIFDKWSPSRVRSMARMFRGTTSFFVFGNLLNGWDVSSVTDFSSMFEGSQFAGNVNGWTLNTSEPILMRSMFKDCNFQGNLNNWDTQKVVDMSSMFENNGFISADKISSWNTSSVTNMSRMFTNCGPAFNPGNRRDTQQINYQTNNSATSAPSWDVENVENFSNMFADSSFDGDISNWVFNTSDKLIDMSFMFARSNFTGKNCPGGPFSSGDLSNVTTLESHAQDAPFYDALLDSVATQLNKVANIENMFNGCTAFVQDTSDWTFDKQVLVSYDQAYDLNYPDEYLPSLPPVLRLKEDNEPEVILTIQQTQGQGDIEALTPAQIEDLITARYEVTIDGVATDDTIGLDTDIGTLDLSESGSHDMLVTSTPTVNGVSTELTAPVTLKIIESRAGTFRFEEVPAELRNFGDHHPCGTLIQEPGILRVWKGTDLFGSKLDLTVTTRSDFKSGTNTVGGSAMKLYNHKNELVKYNPRSVIQDLPCGRFCTVPGTYQINYQSNIVATFEGDSGLESLPNIVKSFILDVVDPANVDLKKLGKDITDVYPVIKVKRSNIAVAQGAGSINETAIKQNIIEATDIEDGPIRNSLTIAYSGTDTSAPDGTTAGNWTVTVSYVPESGRNDGTTVTFTVSVSQGLGASTPLIYSPEDGDIVIKHHNNGGTWTDVNTPDIQLIRTTGAGSGTVLWSHGDFYNNYTGSLVIDNAGDLVGYFDSTTGTLTGSPTRAGEYEIEYLATTRLTSQNESSNVLTRVARTVVVSENLSSSPAIADQGSFDRSIIVTDNSTIHNLTITPSLPDRETADIGSDITLESFDVTRSGQTYSLSTNPELISSTGGASASVDTLGAYATVTRALIYNTGNLYPDIRLTLDLNTYMGSKSDLDNDTINMVVSFKDPDTGQKHTASVSYAVSYIATTITTTTVTVPTTTTTIALNQPTITSQAWDSGDQEIDVAWTYTPSVGSVSEYRVRVVDDSGNTVGTIISLAPNISSHSFSGFGPGLTEQTYRVDVGAMINQTTFTGFTRSASVTVAGQTTTTSTTTQTPLGMMDTPSIEYDPYNGEITASWTAFTQSGVTVTGYQVLLWGSASTPLDDQSVGASATEYTFTGHTPQSGQLRYVQVRQITNHSANAGLGVYVTSTQIEIAPGTTITTVVTQPPTTTITLETTTTEAPSEGFEALNDDQSLEFRAGGHTDGEDAALVRSGGYWSVIPSSANEGGFNGTTIQDSRNIYSHNNSGTNTDSAVRWVANGSNIELYGIIETDSDGTSNWFKLGSIADQAISSGDFDSNFTTDASNWTVEFDVSVGVSVNGSAANKNVIDTVYVEGPDYVAPPSSGLSG